MCLTGGAVTAQAPAGQAAAGRVAPRLTVAIATTPDLGAAQTLIPPTSGQVPPQNPANLSTTAGTHVVQVCASERLVTFTNTLVSRLF